MHLKQLKLAGFKSFVEPTIVPFPSQLAGVVGPNGCGKSNIIDAVRWVMGESSAKTLRGESMVDVIFNGSSNRKPVGQASVELVFDNSAGRLTGQYASYQEIAVKRLVTRDGDSAYFLNGTRCRRRDIQELFLGTGAGARGYAIIGQDMISKLIEARPEELKTHLEEAAGISKYKERRRETMQRIEQTQENLARVTDIIDELGKQLARLERQAKTAQRFKHLKEDERQCKVEILVLKWAELHEEAARIHQQTQILMMEFEASQSVVAASQKESFIIRTDIDAIEADCQSLQSQYYQLGNEIARLEESALQQQRERKRIEADQAQLQTEWQHASVQFDADGAAMQISEALKTALQKNLQELKDKHAVDQTAYNLQQQQAAQWSAQWQAAQSALAKATQVVQIETLKCQHLKDNRHQAQLRIEKIQNELNSIRLEDTIKAIEALQSTSETYRHEQMLAEESCSQAAAALDDRKGQLTTIENNLRVAQDKAQHLATQEAVCSAALKAAMQANQTLPDDFAWKNSPRMLELLTVEPLWHHSFEWVFGHFLQAFVLDSISPAHAQLSSLQHTAFTLVAPTNHKMARANYPKLIDKVHATSLDLTALIHDEVFAASDLEQALEWLPHIQEHQSIVTPDGYWLSPAWIRIANTASIDEHGLLHQQQLRAHLLDELNTLQADIALLKTTRDACIDHIAAENETVDRLKKRLFESRESTQQVAGQLQQKQRELAQGDTRKAALADDLMQLTQQLEAYATELFQIEQSIEAAVAQEQQLNAHLGQFSSEKHGRDDTLQQLRQALESSRTQLHQTELAFDRETLKIQQLKDNQHRGLQHLEALKSRLQTLEAQRFALEEPVDSSVRSLDDLLLEFQAIEAKLNEKKHDLDDFKSKLALSEESIRQKESESKAIQELILQKKMDAQAIIIRTSAVMESCQEFEVHPELFLQTQAIERTYQQVEQDLKHVSDKIKSLGPINLVAIEEYETESLRKQHLDEQHQDLSDSIVLLEAAIAQMDDETMVRLKDTFDAVNESFQALFPRLFGGGHAKLVLTCDNLLEAGVLVMAQPPGKRNSTIHLLSGGEKAMTAVGLVFALFQLNPAPFCMLDEVDAPLDEANVRRFCDMVKEMSNCVQFLFITHNKTTMELADHLIGVTMREPGVSRVVAVDVEEALSIAE